jgi:hypothetical protein
LPNLLTLKGEGIKEPSPMMGEGVTGCPLIERLVTLGYELLGIG